MSQIAKAASVLLTRGPGSRELFVVRRAENLRFMGGFVAFPGGKTGPEDREIAEASGLGADKLASAGYDRRVTAVRELFEETGVLLVRRQDGTFPAAGSTLQYLRRKIIAGELTFVQILDRLGATVDFASLHSLGGITTPPFVPMRFDTAFFLADLPPNQEAEVWPGELQEGEWLTAAATLERWRRGEWIVSPPTVAILEAIEERPAADIPNVLLKLFQMQSGDTIHTIYFAPDVLLIPLQTLALPPSTHTNAYLVGRENSYLLDPGPSSAEEQARLFRLVDAQLTSGRVLKAVVLSHHHPDHTGAAMASSERYRVPIHAHPITAEKLRGKLRVDHEIQEGDRLDLGTAPDGSGPWHLEAILTPGHAPGHLVFYEPRYRLLFAGDMVSTLSSIVIAPPDGDLAVYLNSLRRLLEYDIRLLLPSHGSPSPRPRQTIEESLLHRATREEQLVAALGPVPRSVPDLARDLYKGLPPVMMRFAELQILAGLQKLQREGRVLAASSEATELWSKEPD